MRLLPSGRGGSLSPGCALHPCRPPTHFLPLGARTAPAHPDLFCPPVRASRLKKDDSPGKKPVLGPAHIQGERITQGSEHQEMPGISAGHLGVCLPHCSFSTSGGPPKLSESLPSPTLESHSLALLQMPPTHQSLAHLYPPPSPLPSEWPLHLRT